MKVVAIGMVAIVVLSLSRVDAQTGTTTELRTVEENYSILGTVNSTVLSSSLITISSGVASDGQTKSEFTFDLSTVQTMENSDYQEIHFDQIRSGDTVILQGIEEGGSISITRLIDFPGAGANDQATSTETTSTASSTVGITATSSAASSATSSDSMASSTIDTSAPAATSTDPLDSIASSTNDTATSTPPADTTPASSTDPVDPSASTTDNI